MDFDSPGRNGFKLSRAPMINSAPSSSKEPFGLMPLTIPPPPTAMLQFLWARRIVGLTPWYPPPAGLVPYILQGPDAEFLQFGVSEKVVPLPLRLA